MRLSLFIMGISFSFYACAELITIHGEDDWAPYASVSADKQTVIGFAPDIIRAAFKSQDVDVIFKPYPYPRCMESALSGEAIACFDTVLDESVRKKYIHNLTPIFVSRIVIWVPAHSNESNLKLNDLLGKKVGVVHGFEYSVPFTREKRIVKEASTNELSILRKISLGRIQYGLTYEMPGLNLVRLNPELKGKVKIAGVISTEKIFVSFSKAHKQGEHYSLVFEKGLKAIKANGAYRKIESGFKNTLPGINGYQ